MRFFFFTFNPCCNPLVLAELSPLSPRGPRVDRSFALSYARDCRRSALLQTAEYTITSEKIAVEDMPEASIAGSGGGTSKLFYFLFL